MESKIVFGKEENEVATDSTNKIVVKKVGKNDLVILEIWMKKWGGRFFFKRSKWKRVGWILSCYYLLADKNFLWAWWEDFRKKWQLWR